MDISIVIVNYCNWKLLNICLSSLARINQEQFTFEVIVIDNSPGYVPFEDVKKKFKNFKFFKNSGNNGFANGCNLGAAQAIGKYLLFLNPDTIVSQNSIYNLFAIAEINVDYGILSCEQVNNRGKKQTVEKIFPSLLTFSGIARVIYRLHHRQKIKKRFSPEKTIIFPDWVSGSVVFMSKRWFEDVGGWNEDFWMYYEDVDICKRVLELGGDIVLLKEVGVIHQHGGSSRINLKTEALTKSEVIISKHVYINNHYKSFEKFLFHALTILSTMLEKLFLTILAIVLFFIPKFSVHRQVFVTLLNYYLSIPFRGTWLSPRSANYKKKQSLNYV